MRDEKELKAMADLALAHSRASQTEVLLFVTDSALTRFANNHIHQNVAERNASLMVRAAVGRRIGVASSNIVAPQGVKDTVERAGELARLAPENPDFISLPPPAPIRSAEAYFPATARFGPQERATAVGVICGQSKEKELVASGAFSVATSQMVVANSLGVFAHHMETVAELSAVIKSLSSSGYAHRLALDVSQIDPVKVAQEAIDKAVRGQDPTPLEPGEYEVILEEYAVSDILDALAYLGFSALAVQEGRSFMAGRLGQRVVGENITIWDDGLGAATVPMPFDFEGVPKERVDLIADGVARGVCYDSYTAGKEGRVSTGHALPPGETFGPVPLNLFLKEGQATKEEMIASTQRGVYVTRFWYTRPVEPMTVTITGMTRDGTFLVEKGEITRPIRNLRFTQSYLDVLRQVELIGRESKLERTGFSYNRVPALKVGRFNFTGATEF
ncbi:MAG: TldD/PmbA family protein [Chloroflexi bacterium]|nr:TldD/PmbA family protein [Chloroflexota bacterium]